jgi:hypothetical protein
MVTAWVSATASYAAVQIPGINRANRDAPKRCALSEGSNPQLSDP